MPTQPLRSRLRTSILLWVGTLAVTMLVLGLALWFTVSRRRDSVALAVTSSRNLALSIDLSLSSTLSGIDLALGTVSAELERELAGGRLDLPRLRHFFAAEERLLPEAMGLWATDDQGGAILGSGTAGPKISYADRDYFRQLRDGAGSGMVCSKPQFGHITHKWIIICARRYNRPNGSFGGTVMIPVSIANLHARLMGFALGKGGTLVLRNLEGDLLTRNPEPVATEREPPSFGKVSTTFKEIIQSGVAQKTYFIQNPVDHVWRTYTLRRLQGYPLVVLAGLAENDYLGPWRQDCGRMFALISMFLVCLWLLTWQLQQALRDRERNTLALLASEARNRQLQKAESLGRMAGSIAHHFNNKLQSVRASLDLLGQVPLGDGPGRILAHAQRATEAAAEVSRMLLVYLGQTHGTRELVSLVDLCSDTLPLLGGGPVLVTDAPAHALVVRANADEFRQVLRNLVSNAREALGDAGGTVRVLIGTCAGKDIPSTHRHPLDWEPREPVYATLAVEDPGSGITEEDLDKVFDPFYSTRFPGRGLGLPVVLGHVQALGGAITVTSRPGKGSLFRVFLPLAAPGLVPPPVAPPPAPAGGGTILLVDDDPAILEAAGELIQVLGFDLLTAGDGVEAIEVFEAQQGRIRCVITDLSMPRMDGWATLAALHHMDPSQPVILTSGYDQGKAMAEARNERPAAFLGKPFSLQQLQEAIGQALAG